MLDGVRDPPNDRPSRPRGPTNQTNPYRSRVRWIIDGMNVIGCRPDGWWKDRRRAMAALVDSLEQWARRQEHGIDVTVVFEKPPTPPIHSATITVTHADRAAANSADDEIVRLVQRADDPQEICVVTSDYALSARVRNQCCTVHPSAAFRRILEEQ